MSLIKKHESAGDTCGVGASMASGLIATIILQETHRWPPRPRGASALPRDRDAREQWLEALFPPDLGKKPPK